MSAKTPLLWLSLLTCVGFALAIVLVGALDKEGTLNLRRAVADPVAEAALLTPFAVIAGLAMWARARWAGLVACLLAAAGCGIWATVLLWLDHLAWRRERPGQETMHMALLGALIVLWAGCAAAALVVVGDRLLARRSKSPAGELKIYRRITIKQAASVERAGLAAPEVRRLPGKKFLCLSRKRLRARVTLYGDHDGQ